MLDKLVIKFLKYIVLWSLTKLSKLLEKKKKEIIIIIIIITGTFKPLIMGWVSTEQRYIHGFYGKTYF